MKRIFLALTVLAILSNAATAERHRVLRWDDRSVTFEVTPEEPEFTTLAVEKGARACRVDVPGFFRPWLEGELNLPARRYLIEVGRPENVTLEIVELRLRPLDGIVPEIFRAGADGLLRAVEAGTYRERSEVALLAGVGVHRKRNIAAVDVSPVVYDGANGLRFAERIVLRLSFAPRGGEERPVELDHDRIIVNAEQATVRREGRPLDRTPAQRTPFEFSLSDDWLRLRVGTKGIYVLTHNDLLGAGVNPAAIDPSTIRLFSGGPLPQPDSIPYDLTGDASWAESYHLTEHAVLYRGAGVTEFLPGDSLFFFGVGVDGWLDDIDPAAPGTARYEHPYENENVYWLTWGGSFTGLPRRIAAATVAPQGPGAAYRLRTYEERIHIERDVNYDAIFTDDRWYWTRLKGGSSIFRDLFTPDRIAGTQGRLRTMCYGEYKWIEQRAICLLNGVPVDTLVWRVESGYRPQRMPVMDRAVSNLHSGTDTFTLLLDAQTSNDEMYIFWYDVFYTRELRQSSGRLDFRGPPLTGRTIFKMAGFPSGPVYLFDVTDHEDPVMLVGAVQSGDTTSFEYELGGAARHFHAAAPYGLRKPALAVAGRSGARLPSLRDEGVGPHMLVIHHERFRDAALSLAAHRSSGVPGVADPYVKTVDITTVYDNFSGGLKDPIAIRNYLKFLYDSYTEAGDPVIQYVLLLGNGNYDHRNRLGRGTDFVPYYINRYYANEYEAIEDEDFFVKLDGGIDRVPDIAVGRMPVLSAREANSWVARIIGYDQVVDPGSWQNEVILVADDEYYTNGSNDWQHLEVSEDLSADDGPFPQLVDFKKIYLHHYPFLGEMKPGARNDLLKEWSDGALLVNYIGHGSPYQLADERVMLNSDIYSLTNRLKCPVFMSFSCSIAELADPYTRSYGQNLVTYDGGGAIGLISANAGTYGIMNEPLNLTIVDQLFTSKYGTGTEPLGRALLYSKMLLPYFEPNNAKYVLLGDPAMKIAMPHYTVEHDVSSLDTMLTGGRYTFSGAVVDGGQQVTSFDGTAEVIVQEATERIDKIVVRDGVSHRVQYWLPGKVLFKGTVDVVGGRFDADFVVPKRCRTGPRARIRSYVATGAIDGVGAVDTLFIAAADSFPDNAGGPLVRMYFEGQATKVKPGAKLVAEISDPEGIAILGTDPQSSIYLEFDRSGLPIFVTDFFEYDHGSSTMGHIEYPLQAGFEPGGHTVVLKAFDNLGEAASDTLSFEIVEAGVYAVSDVFNFPNPASDGTNFVFQLSNRADVHLRVFNVSGLMIWERRVAGSEGFNSIYWDGRDSAGDRPANGTYIYVLDVEFPDSFNRAETVKGMVVLLR